MNSIFPKIGAVALLALFVIAPLSTFAAVNAGPSCVALSQNLSRGSSGSDVSSLQRFLVAQNYPGGGSWMVTGYYGLATEVSVKNFQISAGLSQTGVVDSATRAAIQSYSCGTGTSYNYTPYNYNQYSYTPYNYDQYGYGNQYGQGIVLGASTGPYYTSPYTSCTYYNCSGQSINVSYITPSAGSVGTDVIVYGAGFTENNNTVHFGSGIVPFLRSSNNGTILSFKVPSTLTGYGSQSVFNQSYEVYVTNSYGQNSNRVNFAVTGGASSGSSLWVSTVTGPNTLATNTSGSWNITVRGPVNAAATVEVVWGDEYISNTTTSKQSVFFGGTDTKTVSFSHSYSASGSYTPTFIISNSYNAHSSSAQTVVVGSGYNYGQTYLNSLSPTSGQAGTQVVLFGSGFSSYDNVVHFGIGGLRNVTSISNGTALYFTVPHYISPCDTTVGTCNVAPTLVTPGSYPIYVTSNNGTTQTLNFTVTN